MDVESIAPIIKKIALFGGLTDEQIGSVSKLLETAKFHSNDLIFKEGTEPSHIYIIKSGKVKINCETKIDNEPFEIVILDVGECFGETSVIGILPHSGSAIAMEDSELIILSRNALMKLYHTDAKLFGIIILNIAREACRRLYRTNHVLLQYAAISNNHRALDTQPK